MNLRTATVILVVSFFQQATIGAAPAIMRSNAITVGAAYALCRTHPSGQEQLSIRGWFVANILAYGYLEGGLFPSSQAVPATTADKWDRNGNWKRYGALYVHITTYASFGSRIVTLHGRLDCASYRFETDRDPFPPPHLQPTYGTIRGPHGGSVTTWATAGGLKLTLTVPRRTYPRNALTRVSVSIQNVSRHDIGFWTPGVGPVGVTAPQPEVLDRFGELFFPPVMSAMPPLPGPAPRVEPLHPGQMVHGRDYIVVRADRIRASQRFTPKWLATVQRALNTLVTRPTIVRLISEPAPNLTLRQTTSGPVVEVTRPAGVTGRVMLLSYADCGVTGSGPGFKYSFGWVHSGLHLTPGCSPVGEWHLRVAWLNHPVAALDYAAPQPTPSTTLLVGR